jgi:hypothetical protein
MTAHSSRRRRIRLAILAAACLLLGAATTVGVAWWLGRPDKVSNDMYDPKQNPLGRSGIGAANAFKVARAEWWLEVYPATTDGNWGHSVLITGWPWRALRSEHGLAAQWLPPPLGADWQFLSWKAGIVAPQGWTGMHSCLGVRPLFPGFALNTALYAATWYLLLFTPLPLYRAARRRSRVSRGMCPACAYNLEGSPSGPCPECGHAVGVMT